MARSDFMKVLSFLLIAALLLVGVILLWPPIASPKLGNPKPGANVMVVQPSTVGSPENAFALSTTRSSPRSNNPSLHARFTTDGLHQKPSARNVEMHRLREEWNIPPAPRAVKGPPGKPNLLEGVTKDEVLAAWGPPKLIKPSRPLQPTPDVLHDDDGEEHLTSYRPLEEWHYETEDGIKAFAYWTEDGRLSALGIDPMDFKRLRLDTRRLMIKQLDKPQPNDAPQSPPSSPLN